jgi:ATP-dependent Clp protease ATP-binding subunit ClpC
MANCSVCGKPATSQITITENGQRRQLTLCDEHYMEFMARNQHSLSPLESLFHGGLFDSLFDDTWLPLEDGSGRARLGSSTGQERAAPASAGAAGGQPGGRPRRHRRAREAVDLQSFLSQSGLDCLQAAAQKAVEFGKGSVALRRSCKIRRPNLRRPR